MFARRGRILDEANLNRLLQRKAEAYCEVLASWETLPLYPGLTDFLLKLRLANLHLALVSGAMRLEIETVLERAQLRPQFPIIVAGDDISTSKPDPAGYLKAIEQLNAAEPGLDLQPSECLAIEDSFAGIEAAKRAGIPVVGVANMFPQHMLLRVANWVVDELAELEFDRVMRVFSGQERAVAAPQVSAMVEIG
jgi:phosphoglycolate phosphatase/beta-phosphoglucomutase